MVRRPLRAGSQHVSDGSWQRRVSAEGRERETHLLGVVARAVFLVAVDDAVDRLVGRLARSVVPSRRTRCRVQGEVERGGARRCGRRSGQGRCGGGRGGCAGRGGRRRRDARRAAGKERESQRGKATGRGETRAHLAVEAAARKTWISARPMLLVVLLTELTVKRRDVNVLAAKLTVVAPPALLSAPTGTLEPSEKLIVAEVTCKK